jgi:hypothetical protein
MRSNFVLLLLVGSLSTLACNKEETANPDDVKPETTGEPAPTEDPATTEEPAADPELTAVCQHMMDLMIADLGDTMELTPEAQEEAKAACAIDLASKRAENPEEFATKLECITAATNLEQSVACG